MKVLIVEDERNVTEVVKAYLEKDGYKTEIAYNGKEAINKFYSWEPSFVVLDLMLPGLSGEEICKKIRKHSSVPILMLTAKSNENDRINGLEIGADDYLVKPFSPRELVMRVKTIMRRMSHANANAFEKMAFNNGDLVIVRKEQLVIKNGTEIKLTPNEFKLLCFFANNPNQVLNREQILEHVMGFEYEGFDRTIDSHIKNLRKKIEDNAKKPVYIQTIFGFGYRFGGR